MTKNLLFMIKKKVMMRIKNQKVFMRKKKTNKMDPMKKVMTRINKQKVLARKKKTNKMDPTSKRKHLLPIENKHMLSLITLHHILNTVSLLRKMRDNTQDSYVGQLLHPHLFPTNQK